MQKLSKLVSIGLILSLLLSFAGTALAENVIVGEEDPVCIAAPGDAVSSEGWPEIAISNNPDIAEAEENLPAEIESRSEPVDPSTIMAPPADLDQEASPLPIEIEDFADAYQSDEIVAAQNKAAEEWMSSNVSAQATTDTGARMSIAQLHAKFPSGMYWNHAFRPGADKALNYADGYTDIPCPAYHTDTIESDNPNMHLLRTCNTYYSGDMALGWQCHGYALKLGYDATGVDPYNWTKRTDVNALNALKAGDIVRINNDHHTIFILGVEGENVIFTDCNEGDTCVIRWDKFTTLSNLRENFTYLLVCPTVALAQENYWAWSNACIGYYTTTVYDLHIYSSNSFQSNILGTIPGGASVIVYRESALFYHINYNGIEGYAEKQYFRSENRCSIIPSYSQLNLRIPDVTTARIKFYCDPADSGMEFYVEAYDATGFARGVQTQWAGWDANTTNINMDVTAVGAGDAVLTVSMKEKDSDLVMASCEVKISVAVERTYLEPSNPNVKINTDVSPSQTITLNMGGYRPGTNTLTILQATNNICHIEWGKWESGKCDMTIVGDQPGYCTLIVGLKCNDVIRASTGITVEVSGSAYIEPSISRVNLNMPDVSQRTVTLLVKGLTPRPYSAHRTLSNSGYFTTSTNGFYKIGEYDAIDVIVTGIKAGSGTITVDLYTGDSNSKNIFATLVIPVTVYQSSMNTPDFRIPRVQTIEEESFSNIAARTVQIPSSVTSIESKAFANNNRLSQIYIPAAVQSIATDAFSGTYGFTIFGAADSYAETFALEKGYTFIPLS